MIYNDFGRWINGQYPFKIQKISIDAGFSCPNRDGRIGTGGCTFCDNRTFSPAYTDRYSSISSQIEKGKDFFQRKYSNMKFLAYFQSFTNTYAPTDRLKQLYEEALGQEDIVGLVIGTRPDCVTDELLDYLAEVNKSRLVIIEYGVESIHDATLRHIHRGHTFECSAEAIRRSHQRGLTTGVHMILGLPGEDREMILRQADVLSSLPIDILKIHQMQIIRGTQLAKEFARQPFHVFTVEEYIEIVAEYIARLRDDIVIDRFVSESPKELLVAPRWGLKNFEFTNLLTNHLRRHGIRQGSKWRQTQNPI